MNGSSWAFPYVFINLPLTVLLEKKTIKTWREGKKTLFQTGLRDGGPVLQGRREIQSLQH